MENNRRSFIKSSALGLASLGLPIVEKQPETIGANSAASN